MSEPPIFWIFSTDILPQPSVLVHTISTTGDECHYEIQQLSDRDRRKVFEIYGHDINRLYICAEDGSYQIPTVEQLYLLSLEFEQQTISDL